MHTNSVSVFSGIDSFSRLSAIYLDLELSPRIVLAMSMKLNITIVTILTYRLEMQSSCKTAYCFIAKFGSAMQSVTREVSK